MGTESSFYHTEAIGEVDAAFLSLIAHGYDDSGREISISDGAGPLPAAVTTFTYDLRGLRSSVTDASGNTTSYGYDHAERLVEEIDPRGNSSY